MTDHKKRNSKDSKELDTSRTNTTKENVYDFPIVGIGSSAGGLNALKEFCTNLSGKADTAFILISHMDPDRETNLDEILKNFTQIKVKIIETGEKIRKKTIYILPPSKNLVLKDKELILKEMVKKRGKRLPIDSCFFSLAEELKEKSIGIVLSGTGTDGTLGLKAIKGRGGMVMVQDPETAEYSGMPRSAISHTRPDYVLPPKEMPEKLKIYIEGYIKPEITEDKRIETDELENKLDDILHILKLENGNEFSTYKRTTLIRRIRKRMTINYLHSVDEYIKYLKEHHSEIEKLFQEILISVTEFFRKKEAFEKLNNQVIPEIIKGKNDDEPVRIWVAGCATGEEAYSVAILAKEYMKKTGKHHKLMIFSSDIDPEAIQKAREGIYPENIVKDVSEERLNKFFEKKDHIYKVKQEIRDSVIFAVQNAIMDPPFSNMDLISCRNLLIYLNSEAQENLLKVFHYALKEDGYLFLGSSETVGLFSELFTEVDKKAKIYQKESYSSHISGQLKPFPPIFERTFIKEDETYYKKKKYGKEQNYEDLVRELMLKNYTPSSVIVNKKNQILYTFGKTGKYLELPEGKMNMNIVKMARKGLELHLVTSLRKARMEREETKIKNIPVKTNGEEIRINLTIQPIKNPQEMDGLLLVVFQEVDIDLSDTPTTKIEDIPVSQVSDERVKQLQEELKYYRSHLQSTVKELETTNEELKSANEELQSSNEELKSTNEELQTSKEELQSVNEELLTVNNELEAKVDELADMNDDLNNFISSTDIATIFVDENQNIKRFTPPAKELFNIIDTDIGRPLSHLSSNLIYGNLEEDVKKVQKNLIPIEKDIQTESGKWYTMRIVPYRTEENRIEGVVATFFDITNRKKIEQQLKKSERRYKEAYERMSFYKDLLTHDINNVLQIILLNVEQLTKNDQVKAIEKQIEEATQLIENVKKFSKIETSSTTVDKIDIAEVINKTISVVKDSYPSEDIEITFEHFTKEPIALASKFIDDAFINILSNSIIHNDNSPKKINIHIETVVKDDQVFYKIVFEDNGKGINLSEKEKILNGIGPHKFDHSEGLGMGTTIIKKIITNSGGELKIENRIKNDHKKGTRFIVFLPRKPED